ncbi:hypothetical protein [Borrelia miyamotoi]|nr:hypothetical protein [Borrelia miyamotoi]
MILPILLGFIAMAIANKPGGGLAPGLFWVEGYLPEMLKQDF